MFFSCFITSGKCLLLVGHERGGGRQQRCLGEGARGETGGAGKFNFSTNPLININQKYSFYFFPIKQVQDLHKIFKSKTRTSKPVHAVQVQCFFFKKNNLFPWKYLLLLFRASASPPSLGKYSPSLATTALERPRPCPFWRVIYIYISLEWRKYVTSVAKTYKNAALAPPSLTP